MKCLFFIDDSFLVFDFFFIKQVEIRYGFIQVFFVDKLKNEFQCEILLELANSGY